MTINTEKSIVLRVLKRADIKGFCGFTLAEVLITLVIIGVIAAMTIPTLMNNTNNQEYVSRLKKTYSELSQVTNRIIAEDGSPKYWCNDVQAFYDKYKKYLLNSRECANSTCTGIVSKNLDGTTFAGWNGGGVSRNRVLEDGTKILFISYSPDCNYNHGGTTNICAIIAVDINGNRGSSMLGRDSFLFALKENGLYPMGCDSEACVNSTGEGCACKVLRENAMNY